MLFTDYAKHWNDTHLKTDGTPLKPSSKAKNWEQISNHLLPTFGNLTLQQITPTLVANWYDTHSLNHPVARHNAYTLLKAILDSATRRDKYGNPPLLTTNPCLIQSHKPRPHHETIIAETDQLTRLYQLMPPQYRLAVYLAGICGLRESEICALQRHDINLTDHTISITKTQAIYRTQPGQRTIKIQTPKTLAGTRTIPYPDFLHKPLTQHLHDYVKHPPYSYLFTNREGKMLPAYMLRAIWNRTRIKEGLPTMWFHDLRKTALTRMVEAGASLGEVMAFGGHSSIQAASLYQKHTKQHSSQLMRRLNNQLTGQPVGQPEERAEKKEMTLTPREKRHLLEILLDLS